jgi:GDP-L-fucose synthase
MNSKPRILVFGADGFIGTAISKEFSNFDSYLGLTRKDLDVRDYSKVKKFIVDFAPTIVINATGKVAGIQGNIDSPVNLMRDNSENILSITKACHEMKIIKMIQFASACIYPLNEFSASKPEDLGTGIIEQTSKAYAISKIFGVELFDSYRRQFGYQWSTIIPTNLYGVGDWNTGTDGHVIAMLTKKFIKAKQNRLPQVEVWGDGKSYRSFLNVIDLAAATKFFVLNDMFSNQVTNLNGEKEVSIYDLAYLIKNVTEYSGEIVFDASKPNGARRKTLNDDSIRKLGWEPKISLSQGITEYVKELEPLTL